MKVLGTSFSPWSCCCFSAKQAAVRRKSKDWLARNQNNESEWSDMSIHVLSRANQSLLFLLTAAFLAEKQQQDQGEKLVPNSFIIFFFYFFLFTGLYPVHIHTPTCFQGPDDC
jgi:hypothetical protein